MNRSEWEGIIVAEVTNKQGCKGTELATALALRCPEEDFPGEIIDDLVKQKRLIEVEYCLPSINYRLKSFYLPAGTQVVLKGAADGMVEQ